MAIIHIYIFLGQIRIRFFVGVRSGSGLYPDRHLPGRRMIRGPRNEDPKVVSRCVLVIQPSVRQLFILMGQFYNFCSL